MIDGGRHETDGPDDQIDHSDAVRFGLWVHRPANRGREVEREGERERGKERGRERGREKGRERDKERVGGEKEREK